MNFGIGLFRAYETVVGSINLYPPESKRSSGGRGILRPMKENDFPDISIMVKTTYALLDNPLEPISGSLNSLPPITLEVVSGSPLESLWDQLVKQYHYLGYQRLLGHRLKYLAFIQNRPVAALSWSAPALKLGVRDHFIGWSEHQRKTYLNRIVNNSRFLIVPWVRVHNLASHVLSMNMNQVVQDWEKQFNTAPWLLETFVDPVHFKGTTYRAANWHCIGYTYGCGKQGRGYVYHGSIKEVYVYVVERTFRKIIGCEQKPYDLVHRPPPSLKKLEELTMILRHANWNPQLVPWMELTEKDVEIMADELVTFHEQFHDCLGRIEHHRLGLAYISGLMSNMEAKSAEPVALEFLGEKGVRPLQRFMKEFCWDHEAMELKNQLLLSPLISAPDGMVNVDSCEFIKKGKESVGVARQYCGSIGKVENCQSGVFVGYSSKNGYALLRSRLYMPEIWFSSAYEQRRKDNLVPEDLTFQTKIHIALELITTIAQSKLFPARWIGCDATFGSDIHFLESLPKGYYYFADIRSNTKVFLKKPQLDVPPYKGRGRRPKKLQLVPDQPQPQRVADIARSTKCRWKSVVLAEGAKGPLVAQVARLRVYPSRDGLPKGSPVWLFIRRNPDEQMKFSISNAPKNIPLSELCRASVMRWPIEQCFEEGKDQLGMDHYEHRSWPAWHRHMIYVFLALHFLLRLRIRFKKKPGSYLTPSTEINSSNPATAVDHFEGGNRNSEISYLS